MRAYRSAAVTAALLYILAPSDARALDGTITGLKATPNPADVNQDVVVTVLGLEKCKKVSVDFGDNSTPVLIENPDFVDTKEDDNSAIHAYGAEGIYNVTASAVEQCSGSAQTSLTVGAGDGTAGLLPENIKDVLCVMLDNCEPGQKLKPGVYLPGVHFPPHLEALFPFSVIEPGGDVIVLGQRFGKTPGELHMVLKTDQKDVKLQINEWADGYVGGTIPTTTIGVVDQKAEFYVRTSEGSESNRHGDASFTAKRELKLLPRTDVSVVQCSFDGDCNRCLNTVDPDNVDCKGGFNEGTIDADHSRDWGTVGNAEGTDVYAIKTLKNGWKLDNVLLKKTIDPGEEGANVSFTSSQIKVDWWVTPHDTLWYSVDVTIKGPEGTAYK